MNLRERFKPLARTLVACLLATDVLGASTDLATAPLVTSSTTSVLPNILFVLDDSGSMDWNYLPDWASGAAANLFKNADYNGVYYNPAISYTPPLNADGSSKTSMTSGNTTGWTAVPDDGFGVQSSSTSNLVGSASYYTFIPGEYCKTAKLRSCNTQAAANATYPYAGKLRWCTDATATGICQSNRIDSGTTLYQTARYPRQATATLTLSGSGSTTVTNITVNGSKIMSAATTAATSPNIVASQIVANVNACSAAATGACQVAGYSASASGSVVTLNAPATAGNIAYTPVVTVSGMTITPAAFGGYSTPGVNLLTNIAFQQQATISVGGTSAANATVDSIKINGKEIMSATSSGSTSSTTVAANIATRINACTAATSGTCQIAGYSATSSGSTVTLYAPTSLGDVSAYAAATVHAAAGSFTYTATIFATTGSNSYVYPFTSTKAAARTDCAGTTCTFAEEMTNYANWWAYYQTRMQMMKTAVSQAFSQIGNNYRVGYLSINNNTGSDMLNLATFDSTQKSSWYTKFFAAVPSNSTPLRQTLAEAGRIYAGKYNGLSYNGVTVVDPMQYSCQQNFTILSTDGYWNEANSNVKEIDGSTTMGNWDSTDIRPMNDGGSGSRTDTTPYTTVTETTTVTPNGVTTTTYTYTHYDVGSTCTTSNGKAGYKLTTTNYSRTETLTGGNVTSVADDTSVRNRVVVYTNGVLTSDTYQNPVVTSAPVSSSSTGTTTYSPGPTNAGWTTASSSGPTCTRTSSLPGAVPRNGSGTPISGDTAIGSTQSQSGMGAATTTSVTLQAESAGATTSVTTTTGGTSNTLADVAEHYYMTDLRTEALGNCTGAAVTTGATTTTNNVCGNNVPTSGLDGASWQHMTTFTMGLGATGFMQFSPTYATDKSGDFFDVKSGSTTDTTNGVCIWQSSGACNWPVPVSNDQTTIDDLWHAGVNGRGAYYSAGNPVALSTGLSNALAGVSARTGASAAATTSNPNVTSGDNFVFSSTFTTVEWDGELVRQQLDLTTGVASSTIDWAAQAKLDAAGFASRNILVYDSAAVASSKSKAFTWANLSTTEKAYFNLASIATLSQFCSTGGTCLNATAQADAAGQKLVDFLRGDRSNEGATSDTTKYFHQRTHVLGDIVNAEAAHVKCSLYTYAENDYSAFNPPGCSRNRMVYAAANDGMLHAFNGDTGDEKWAYIPSFVLPNLYQLADKNYSAKHTYLVDGTPTVGDTYFDSGWHTILVAGLNRGGRGYYALDITSGGTGPDKVLWEFSDNNLGYTYGNPVITKLQNGTWVVLVTSGYNNNQTNSNGTTGDGIGRLYILNAATGAVISTISTGVGSTATPSGLARINVWVDDAMTNNTGVYAYGGDVLGNLWRFDINNGGATLLATLSDGSKAQPITTRPELGDINGNKVVFVGTGRYLGTADLADASKQSLYAIKDPGGAFAGYGSPRGAAGFVKQTFAGTTCPSGTPATVCTAGQQVRTNASAAAVNWATNSGWYVDFVDAGERDNTDPALALGTLVVNTNVPNADTCTAGGYSWRYFLDYRTGGAITTANGVVGVKLGNALATRGVLVRLPNNTVVELSRMSDGTTVTSSVPIGGGGSSVRRISWRELVSP